MASCAILIGFIYPGSKKELPGTLIDLYTVHKLLLSRGFDKIYVITDLDVDPMVRTYHKTILKGQTDVDILGFISDLKKNGQHHLIKNGNVLLENIKNMLEGVKKCLLYFSGHGEKKGLVCPEGIVTWIKIRDAIFSSLQGTSQVLLVVDTCHAWHFQLPYALERKKNHLTFVGTDFFPVPQVIAIITQGDEAAAIPSGSLLTKSLCRLLDSGIDQYFLLQQRIEADLRTTETLRSMGLGVAIYSTKPTTYRAWDWLLHGNRQSYAYDDGVFIFL